MASGWYTKGLRECMDTTVDITASSIRIMLVDSDYVYDADHEVVDNGADDTTDPSFEEMSVTGYTGGHQGAGRKQGGANDFTLDFAEDDANNRVNIGLAADLTWSSLSSGGTIGGAILMKDGTSDDTDARLIAFWDLTDTATNGGDITLDFTPAASGGNLRLSLV